MEQSLRMKYSQHLAMTVQMQQALRLLQMSSQELREAVEKEYMENPALELEYVSSAPPQLPAEYPEEEAPGYREGDEPRQAEPMAPVGTTLEDELMEQVKFAFPAEQERAIAVFMVGSMDERGYLMVPVEEIMRAMGAGKEAVEGVLRRLQEFEPAGVGARDLRECLRLQAERQGIYEGLVARLIEDHLEEVAASHIRDIAREEKAKIEDVQMAVDIIRTLNPKPGSSYGTEAAGYLRPDVFVRKVGEDYAVSLNEDDLPRLRISKLYRNAQKLDEDAREYIHRRMNAAAWFIRTVEQRRQTICRVVEEIVRRQGPCVEHGMAHLRPMTMKQVAEGLGAHESTVSRAVTNKYAELSWGIVPLRSFFSANIGNEDYAAVQVKTALEELIKGEDPQRPLSDQKLAELLSARGMKISRRTAMKYREQMGYPSSVKRKRYG